ncbi:MAG: glycosyltransferase family 4 protein [Prevotellaceae bacterium]|jgi:glycosyltransferase involved in cell wall biosynthesis|nr:glycosyltransferase family 4 protein [Prevotellaceae bacterium]
MKRNKVLYICTEQAAGMVPYAAQIVQTMSGSSECEVYVLYAVDRTDCYKEVLPRTVTCYRYLIPGNKAARLRYKLAPLALVRRIGHICRTHAITHIHLLTVDYVLAFFVGRLRRYATLIATVHDVCPHETKLSLYESATNRCIYRQCLTIRRKADVLVTNDLTQQRLLRQLYCSGHHGSRQYAVEYHAFPTLVTASMRQTEEMPPEMAGIADYILFFGTIHLYKGVDYLYRAYRQSPVRHQTRLVLAGKGQTSFSHAADAERDGVVRINRFIADAEVAYLYRHARCVVYPYTSVTQTGVLSLAYYFGTPLIVTDIGCFREQVADGETGLRCPPRDADALRRCLEIVTTDHFDRERMRQAQLACYERLYCPQQLMKALEHIYLKHRHEDTHRQ